MELGATVCGRRAPRCARCPVAPLCAARAAGRAGELPAPRRRPAPRPLELGCAIVRRGRALLLARRPAHGLFGGLWTPPLAELAPGRDGRRALAAALRREHGLAARVGPELAACERTLTHRALTLRAFSCEIDGIPGDGKLRFVRPAERATLGLPRAVEELLGRI
jgi:A/G-specific adenine glycosylase